MSGWTGLPSAGGRYYIGYRDGWRELYREKARSRVLQYKEDLCRILYAGRSQRLNSSHLLVTAGLIRNEMVKALKNI